MATVIAKRVSLAAASSLARRVAMGGHGSEYDAWADSWGASWGNTWHTFFVASQIAQITLRSPATPTPSVTQRFAAALTETSTKRISAPAAASNTRRVAMGTHGAEFDCWAGAWGKSWGNSWHNFLEASNLPALTLRVSASPAQDNQIRIPAQAAEIATRRVGSTNATASNANRVAMRHHGSEYDAWADSWGASWGDFWHPFLGADDLPENITQRVLVNNMFLLEGDEAGALLLTDTGDGRLLLEGDVRGVGGALTSRVLEAVT